MWRFRWPLGKYVMLNAERSVICGGAAHKVRLLQEDGGIVGTVVGAVVVTTTVTTLVEGGATLVVVSKVVVTLVVNVVDAGGEGNCEERGEEEDEITDGG